MIAAGSRSHNYYNLFFPDNRIKKFWLTNSIDESKYLRLTLFSINGTLSATPSGKEKDYEPFYYHFHGWFAWGYLWSKETLVWRNNRAVDYSIPLLFLYLA
jgi:hypothetical protein